MRQKQWQILCFAKPHGSETIPIGDGSQQHSDIPAQYLIILFMYFGRVGVLTISLGFLMGDRAEARFRYAETNILIG